MIRLQMAAITLHISYPESGEKQDTRAKNLNAIMDSNPVAKVACEACDKNTVDRRRLGFN